MAHAAGQHTYPRSTMTDQQHTTFYNPATDEILFLKNGVPDILTHTLWLCRVLNIYRPGDWHDMLVTVDLHGVRIDWPFIDVRLPQIREGPWIPYDEVTYGLSSDEIVAFDIWRRTRDPDDIDFPAMPHWDEFTRPVLFRPPPAPAFLPEPTAPPASQSTRHDVAATGLPRLSSHLDPSPPRLPPHIQRIVIDVAIATNAICPITMEPITADTAVITPCGHVFGMELTPRLSVCPVCRAPLGL